MSVAFVKGDLFKHPDLDGLAHGCNCAGSMGAGIAVDFRERFPRMYDEYKVRCSEGRFTPGDVFVWREGDTTVFNLGTQRTWRTRAELPAVERAVAEMVRIADEQGLRRIGLPRIGAGYGRLRWEDVRAVLEKAGKDAAVELVVFEEYVPE